MIKIASHFGGLVAGRRMFGFGAGWLGIIKSSVICWPSTFLQLFLHSVFSLHHRPISLGHMALNQLIFVPPTMPLFNSSRSHTIPSNSSISVEEESSTKPTRPPNSGLHPSSRCAPLQRTPFSAPHLSILAPSHPTFHASTLEGKSCNSAGERSPRKVSF